MWASVQTVRGCPKHCSFCSVWRTDGQAAAAADGRRRHRRDRRAAAAAASASSRSPTTTSIPVTLDDLAQARAAERSRRACSELEALREERFELMERLAQLPDDMVFFTQITMEAAEDPEFLDAMRRAHIRGALVGVESVTPEGLKDVYKGFNLAGEELVDAAAGVPAPRRARARLVHLRAAERPAGHLRRDGCAWPSEPTSRSRSSCMLTPFPGTVDFEKWERADRRRATHGRRRPADASLADPAGAAAEGVHAASDDVARRDSRAARRAPGIGSTASAIWARSRVVKSLRGRARVRADLETLPADVREHRHRDRQRAGGPLGQNGAADGSSLSAPVLRSAHAGTAGARPGLTRLARRRTL